MIVAIVSVAGEESQLDKYRIVEFPPRQFRKKYLQPA